uniref:Toxin 13 isoform b n=1 Tax=Cupiennius salei TaxID=6928 RepID=A0A4Y5UGK6_CUPSA|nr:toxin 13 isoform b precursor [Cupiennius salei]
MKVLVIFAVLSLVIFSNCSAETDEDFFGEESFEADDIIPFIAKEQVRSDCTLRNHDCTDDRHSCCRSKMFKDVCTCFYPSQRSETDRAKKELCTCQQPKHLKYIEKGLQKAKDYATG